MKGFKAILAGLLATVPAACAWGADSLTTGSPAPAFELPGSDGNTYKLADLKGKVVVLAWYPKAFTGG